MRTRYWALLLALAATGCVAAALLSMGQVRTGTAARVLQDGVVLHELPLDRDTTLTVTAANGGTNTVEVRDGAVRVTHATCPDQVCVRQGAIRTTAAPIVCLPHGLVIEIKDGEVQVDAHT